MDGLDPSLVFRMTQEGKLPTLASLINKGTSGVLRTTIPPYSLVAWTSFMTGMEPGGHGVFTNFSFKEGTYERKINNASDVVAPCFWDFLGSAGKRCLVFSVFNTWPVKPVNGLCIAGYIAPSDDVDYTYPKELKQELVEKFGYRLHADNPKELYAKGMHKELMAMWLDRMNRKVNAFCHYLKNEQWDFAVCVVTKGDSVSHHYWSDKVVMEEYYKEADEYVKRLIDAAGKDVDVIVMSDHGFLPIDYNINFNNFLLEKGYLSVRQSSSFNALRSVGLSKKNLQRFLMRLGFEKSLDKISPKVKDLFPGQTTRDIDYSKTAAFVDANSPEYGLIYVVDKQPEVINRLKNDLLSLEHNGVKVVEKVMRREEVYHGHALREAPDVIVKLKPGYYAATFGDDIFTKAGLATHAGNGVFIAAGKHFPSRKDVNYSITDIAPTVLHLFGLPVPYSFDGKVIDALKGAGKVCYQERTSIIDEIQL